jgi:hypothetical protein
MELRKTLAIWLVNLAYHISWEGYMEALQDGEFGYCPDCDVRCPDEPGYCR